MTVDESAQALAVRDAFASVRSSLRNARPFMALAAVAAGMTATQAQAWSSEFEHLGRVIGSEVGRAVGDDRYGPKARVGGLVGEVVGARIGRPADDASREAQRVKEIERQAREQAVRDAAYEAERRRLDPNYRSQVHSSAVANQQYGQRAANLMQLQSSMDAIADEYERNIRAQQRQR